MSTTRPAPSDDQLADIIRFIARTGLEVERGLRSPDHLEHLMDPAAGQRWRRPGSIGRFRGGPVQDGDIGTPQLSRLSDTRVVATVITRTEGRRWGALTVRLDAERGRWHVADLQRLLAASHYRTGPARTVPVEVPAEDRLRLVAEDRRLAGAALAATSRRLAELAADAPGAGAVRVLARSWRNKIAELDRELADLRGRHDTRKSLSRLLRH